MKKLILVLLLLVLPFTMGPVWPRRTAAGGGFSANWTNDFTATGCANEDGSPAATTVTDASSTFNCDSTAELGGDEALEEEAADTGQLDFENVGTAVSSGFSCYQFRYEQTAAPGTDTGAFFAAVNDRFDNSDKSRIYQAYNANELYIKCQDGNNGSNAAISLNTPYWITVEVDHDLDVQTMRISATDYDYDKAADSECTGTPTAPTVSFDSFRIGYAPGTFYLTDIAWGDCP